MQRSHIRKFGTLWSITIYTPEKKYVLEEVFNHIEELEILLTVNEATMESEIEQINHQAGIEPVAVSNETSLTIIADSDFKADAYSIIAFGKRI